MPNQYHPTSNTPIPQPNPKLLAESLKNGDLNLATALAQFAALVRETLKVIEEFADEQVKLNLERKVKFDKMDKLIGDLSEKCQGMQQALLYKEEKYDEKCREVERYKVICELSAKAAVGDNSYYTAPRDENNITTNHPFDKPDPGQVKVNIKLEDQQVDMRPPELTESRRNVKSHIKLSQNQMHLSQYVHPIRTDSPRSLRGGPPSDDEEEDDRRSLAHYYVGGPCKRKPAPKQGLITSPDSRVRERMEIIGGVNVRGQTIRPDLDRSYSSSNELYSEDPNKRVKVSLSGQSNEIMSSSGRVANQMKQRYTEKDLHRQVAGGCWTRLASRRKKEWPF